MLRLSLLVALTHANLFVEDEGLSLLQLRAVREAKDGPVEPYIDQQGCSCTADMNQEKKDGPVLLGPCEGIASGENTIWWLRQDLMVDESLRRVNRFFRKLAVVNPAGETIKFGYVFTVNRDPDQPPAGWNNPDTWRLSPTYTIVNIKCGECPDEAAAQGDPHITTNTGKHFDLDLEQS